MIFSFAVMSVSFCEHTQCLIQRRFSKTFLHSASFERDYVGIWVTVVVGVGLMSLQLWRLSRFGPSAAFDSDRLIVQQKRDSQLEAGRNPDG